MKSELRKKMVEDLQLRGYAERTQNSYARSVRQLENYWHVPAEGISEQQVRDYFLYCRNDVGWSAATMRIAYSGIKFFYTKTLPQDWETLKLLKMKRLSTPPTVLSLFHTAEVQKELGISEQQFEEIRPALMEIDGPWWRARIRNLAEQRTITVKQEALLIDLIRSRFGEAAVRRLRQIELQAQGSRSLIRPEVVAFLGLSTRQVSDLTTAFTNTDELAAKASPGPGIEDAEAKTAWQNAKSKELETARSTLSREQQRLLALVIGNPFDTTKVERIYPLVPELIDSGSWIGEKVRLSELRGKVVLVHFYAYQCGNCIANFPIYNRWQQELPSRGVVVVGIQTPETANERNFDNVAKAAKKDGFKFPVLVDLKSDNWTAWSNTMWPTVYVIDKKGFVRFWWQGELNWKGATGDQKIEELVSYLLDEK